MQIACLRSIVCVESAYNGDVELLLSYHTAVVFLSPLCGDIGYYWCYCKCFPTFFWDDLDENAFYVNTIYRVNQFGSVE